LGESEIERCKAYNVQIILDDIEAMARRDKTLATCANSPAHAKVRLRPN
jgi:hypothetical protein